MVFENGVKNIQAAAYNGARTVYIIHKGQLINFEMSFWYLKFFQKTNEKIRLYYYGTSKNEFVHSFFWKKHRLEKIITTLS
jgi:hypothetical protein